MQFVYTILDTINTDEPVMLLDAMIGTDDTSTGIVASQFVRELMALDAMDKKRIQVWINSPGGSVMEGMAINSAILKTKTKVDTCNVGIAASMAAVIFQAGRTRIMMDYALLMYHNPFGENAGDEELDKIKQSLVTMVATRSGMDETDASRMMDRTSWITAFEALKIGMCDQIEVSSDHNKKRMSSTGDAKAAWSAASAIVNSAINAPGPKNNLEPFKTINKMSKVANLLGLNKDANEDSFCEEIQRIQNKQKENESKVTDLQNKITEKEAELQKLKDEFAELETKHKDQLTKIENSEKEVTKAAAKLMVENFANLGKIKNDTATIEQWTEKAVADMDGTKNLLEGLPTSKTAVKIADVKGGAQEPSSVIGRTMADLRNKYSKN